MISYSSIELLLDPCDGIECPIENETCDSIDGLCKCGKGESCEITPWSPTCSSLTGSCTCGSNPSCNEGTEICDNSDGTCSSCMAIFLVHKQNCYFLY